MDETLNFGQAIEAIKNGMAVSRNGWADKNLRIYLNEGNSETLSPDRSGRIEGISEKLFSLGFTGTSTRLPNITAGIIGGSSVIGWVASQADMLAEDWIICYDNKKR